MIYTFKLLVNKKSSSLSLLKDGVEETRREWKEARDMGRQLLEALQNILEESGIQPDEVGEFLVEGEAPENFTSRRIAETVSRTYLFAVHQVSKE